MIDPSRFATVEMSLPELGRALGRLAAVLASLHPCSYAGCTWPAIERFRTGVDPACPFTQACRFHMKRARESLGAALDVPSFPVWPADDQPLLRLAKALPDKDP